MFKRKTLRTVAKGIFVLLLIGMAVSIGKHTVMADWRTASREPLGIAPDPAVAKEAIVQVYAARAFSWRGIFGVHTWIATKPTDAEAFTVYEIIGWRARHGGSALVITEKEPDQRWFGAEPEIIADKRGPGVDDMIKRIDTAARAYPHARTYTVWPGPNSNTFTAHVARAVPELNLDLPPTAIGKDYLPEGRFAAKTPSGTGYQVSLFGLLGVMAGVEEGVELNILGLTFGIDPKDLAIKLPLAGRLGPS
ncbi:MAG: hypothetical protein CMM77_17330 [Rhodospirillaceae bacterium]|nr:hypothetical protein [Magnetovibrio sp.]MAY68878.1 hypothetical protein [Rhodospirillaceae bacterium]